MVASAGKEFDMDDIIEQINAAISDKEAERDLAHTSLIELRDLRRRIKNGQPLDEAYVYDAETLREAWLEESETVDD